MNDAPHDCPCELSRLRLLGQRRPRLEDALADSKARLEFMKK